MERSRLCLSSCAVRVFSLQLMRVGLVAPRHVGSQFPDQGSNLCPLHWKADSLPLDRQGSPWVDILFFFFLIFEFYFIYFLYSRSLLVSYFIHISVYMSIPISLGGHSLFYFIPEQLTKAKTAQSDLDSRVVWVHTPKSDCLASHSGSATYQLG